jgi:hypothetical protein
MIKKNLFQSSSETVGFGTKKLFYSALYSDHLKHMISLRNLIVDDRNAYVLAL